MDSLRQKLENQGLESVSYMVINHQGEQAQRLHSILEQRLAQSITLHKQDKQQPDVWQKLNGEKDDFLIYDRCGRLTYHISLPYSIIGHGHIEDAIKDTYCKRICGNCTYESSEIPEACKSKVEPEPDNPAGEEDTRHGHSHNQGHNHGNHHHHGHGHHGNHHPHDADGHGHHGHHHGNHGVGDGHDHGHSQSQQGDRQLEYEQERRVSQRSGGQQQLNLEQIQQAMQMDQMPQEALGAKVMQKP